MHLARNSNRCCRYYLNGSDAFRLKLLLPLTEEIERQTQVSLRW